MNTAIQFDQAGNIGTALVCIYQNVRAKLRNNQIEEINEDMDIFDVKLASIDLMLAMLTSTAPVKSINRKNLFQRVKAELKERGQLEPGLLDGLN